MINKIFLILLFLLALSAKGEEVENRYENPLYREADTNGIANCNDKIPNIINNVREKYSEQKDVIVYTNSDFSQCIYEGQKFFIANNLLVNNGFFVTKIECNDMKKVHFLAKYYCDSVDMEAMPYFVMANLKFKQSIDISGILIEFFIDKMEVIKDLKITYYHHSGKLYSII